MTEEIIDAELVDERSSDRAVVLHESYRPTLVLAPDEAKALVDQVKAFQRSVLVEGTDFMKIPGTPKPSLLKPGAERLMQVFGLGHRMEQLEVDRDGDGKQTGVTYRCTVTKMMADGRELTVSSCDGHASIEEPKWRRAPWNTIIKMAQKRALVGATLTATATSGLFTQDMEDMEPREERPRRSSESAPSDDGITAPQIGRIQAGFTDLGITDREQRLLICSSALGREVTSTKNLTKAEASKIIEKLNAMIAAFKEEESPL